MLHVGRVGCAGGLSTVGVLRAGAAGTQGMVRRCAGPSSNRPAPLYQMLSPSPFPWRCVHSVPADASLTLVPPPHTLKNAVPASGALSRRAVAGWRALYDARTLCAPLCSPQALLAYLASVASFYSRWACFRLCISARLVAVCGAWLVLVFVLLSCPGPAAAGARRRRAGRAPVGVGPPGAGAPAPPP
jgi:hypothetical protein